MKNPTVPEASKPSLSTRSLWVERTETLVLALFFLSGAAGLMYEVSWSRQVGLLFGHTAQAGGVVLGCYFAGMAVGYLAAARWVRKVRPLLGYGIAELVVAGWAPLVPWLLSAVETSTLGAWLSSPNLALQTSMRVGLAFALLLPATIGLGASLPFMAEHLSPARRLATGRVTLAYALNTTGALTGVVVTTAILLVVLGVRASGNLAAILSGFCGLVACGLAWKLRGCEAGELANEADAPPLKPAIGRAGSKLSGKALIGLAVLSGFGTLGLQVLYLRMFALTFHNSTYTFGSVVAVFLGGLALGSLLVSRLHRRYPTERLIGWSAALGAVAVAGSVVLFIWLTGLAYFSFGTSFATYMVGAFALVTVVVLPPVTLLGILLPATWKAAEGSEEHGGSVVGRLTAANALAAGLGALAAGFVVAPGIGLWPALGLFAALFGVVPIVLLLRGQRTPEAFGLGLLLLGIVLQAVRTPSQIRTLPPDSTAQIIERWESPYGWLDVVQVRPGYKVLRQNLHYGLGSSGASTPRERRQGHLPLLLHPNPEEVLFLGLGTGLTAGAAVPHPEVERIDIVELIPEVVEAARYFDPENLGVVDHPKVHVRIDDARHDFLGSNRTYDTIISDLFVPWESRAGYLYTVEHFKLARSRLKAGGLFALWLPLYQLGPEEMTMIGDSFASVFPSTTVWWGRLSTQFGMVALVGSESPLELRTEAIDPRLAQLGEALGTEHDEYLGSAADFWKLYAGDWMLRRPNRLNTDEHPRVEFLAPISHRDDGQLTGDLLLNYFDEVFAELPSLQATLERPDGAPLSDLDAWDRQVWQRETLTSGEG